jgi:anti-sigma-K factor RskA
MNWHQHPKAVDQLAAAYVLGTLQGPARRRFESVLQCKPELTRAVDEWSQRLVPLLTVLPPVPPSPALWERIAQRAGIAAPVPVHSAWWKRWLAPIPAGALAMGLLVGVVVPQLWHAQTDSAQETQLPQSYVGVLANAQGKPGVIVSSLRHGRVVEIKQIAPVVLAAGRELHLWRIDKDGHATALGAVANEKWARMTLKEEAEKVFFPAVELAVSSELQGSQPQTPALPYVYRGLCGKLWR